MKQILKNFNSLDFTRVFNTPDADLQYNAFYNFLENTFKETFPIKKKKLNLLETVIG